MSNWKSSKEYQRIQEILEDYWLKEPDEKQVTVCMTFEHSDGSTQNKRIIWINPAFRKQQPLKLKPLISIGESIQPACMRTR